MIVPNYLIRVLVVLSICAGQVFIPCSLFSQVQVEESIQIESIYLNKEVSVSVILPSDYTSKSKNYPVVYLLHGYGGDHTSWLNRCKIDALIDSLESINLIDECIYILPDAQNSYYLNNYDSSYRYSDFFIFELVPYIDSFYHTVPLKSDRALLGMSMGGYGSIMLALKNPDKFGTVIALSASVRDEEIFKSIPQNRYEIFFGQVFGPELYGEDRITDHWKSNSPYFLIDSISALEYSSINWYIDCGLYDYLLPANEAFHQLLKRYGIPHEFHVRPGKHNWNYWYTSTVDGLIFLNEILY